ncbi:collagen binding domain-containing protein [Pseudonocardia sp. KRD291]|uniref:MSCRAMM family protein n=1 Tax=Pseudonocardia sp. KRD291 TaxID=2792007 RepID=UPI001C49DAA7|nr:carboxypeptidase-like regulatory domain-containing protein [Pseudonocardia sp. KRD291]MBW0103166.1 carboxypeptidase regulatory-like domain-containing protein [Pseudonocardia sp. KRD291]
MDEQSGHDGTDRDDWDRNGAGLAVLGTVARGQGVPMAGALVTVTDLSGRQQGRTTTGADGGYRIPISTGGTYLVVAGSGALAPHAAMVAVADRPVRHDVALAGSSGVRGTVADTSGVPLARAAVTLIDARGDVVATAAPDADGRYLLDGVPPGRYTLTVSAEGYQPVAGSIELDGVADRDIVMPGRSGLTGTASAAIGGSRVAGALATLVDADGRTVASAVTGPDGGFAFGDLPAGNYTLTAAGYAPVVTVVQVGAGATTTVDVEFPEPGRPAQEAGER